MNNYWRVISVGPVERGTGQDRPMRIVKTRDGRYRFSHPDELTVSEARKLIKRAVHDAIEAASPPERELLAKAAARSYVGRRKPNRIATARIKRDSTHDLEGKMALDRGGGRSGTIFDHGNGYETFVAGDVERLSADVDKTRDRTGR